MKTCTKCNIEKEETEFSKKKKLEDGLCCQCKECNKAYREANKDKIKAYEKARSQSFKGKLKAYRSSAKERNLSFELTEEQFESFWQADCYYCGDQIATIGIDRIDSTIGYTIENCVACCTVCNVMKMDHSTEAMNMHMLKMLKHQGII